MLRGKRVTLRAIEREDLPRLHQLRANVDLVMLADDRWMPESLARIEQQFTKNLDEPEPAWFGIDIAGILIGSLGLHSRQRPSGSTSLGILISDPDYLGQGYGREALELLLDYAFRIQNWRRVWLQALATNERAIRCYTACGFVHEGRMRAEAYCDGRYVDVVVMGMLRDEWAARRRMTDDE